MILLEVTVFVDYKPEDELLGVKEGIAYALEQFGTVRRVNVQEVESQQLSMREQEVACCMGIRLLRSGKILRVVERNRERRFMYAQIAATEFVSAVGQKLHGILTAQGEPYPGLEDVQNVPPGYEEYIMYSTDS